MAHPLRSADRFDSNTLELAQPLNDPPSLAAADELSNGQATILAGLLGCCLGLMLATWIRLLTPLLGSGPSLPQPGQIWWLVLSLVVAGLAVGWVLQVVRPRPTRVAIAWTAVLLILPYAFGDRLALLALLLRPMSTAGEGSRLLGWCLVAMPLVLPAALGFGASLGRTLATGKPRQLARSLCVVMLSMLLSWLGARTEMLHGLTVVGAWRIVALTLAILALALAMRGWRHGKPWRRFVGSLPPAALAICLASLPGPTAISQHSPIAVDASVTGPMAFSGRAALSRWIEQEQRTIQWATDGRTSGVALATRRGAELRVNGRPVGGLHNVSAEVMSGLIGAALHPRPRRALVVGLGSGTSTGWLAAVPEIERVDVTEVEPAMERAATAFAALHHDALTNPKVRLIVQHGLPAASDDRYDLILIDPSHLTRNTLGLYRAAAKRLAPGGLLLRHLPSRHLPSRHLKIARAELERSLPQVETWQVQHDRTLLVASAEPITPDLERLRTLAEQEPYRGALDWLWGVEGLAEFLVRGETLPGAAGSRVDALDRTALDRTRLATWEQMSTDHDPVTTAFLRGDLRRARIEWATAGQQPSSPFDRLLVAETSAELADDRVPELVEALRQNRPIETEIILARWQLRRRAPAAATRHLLTAFRAAHANPRVYPPTLIRGLELAVELAQADSYLGSITSELFDALEEPFAVWLLDEARLKTRIALASTDPDRCAQAFEAFEPHPPWEDTFLRDRVACYRRTRHPLSKQARQDVTIFEAQRPPSIEQGLLGGQALLGGQQLGEH